jgi:hypothetical protein
VPDLDLIVRQGSVWDVIYEHCSYFGVESLTRSFAACGFDVVRVEETFGRQYVALDARPAKGAQGDAGSDTGDLDRLAAEIAGFRDAQGRKLADWRARIADWRRQRARVAAWGAGAKAVGFLNMLGLTDVVDRVVDINPWKQGRHLAGTGQAIVAPESLRADPPDLVVLMNPVYRAEIAATLDGLGISPELVAA